MYEKTLSSRTAFDGRFLKIDVLEVEQESGRKCSREIVRHPGATAVLPQLPDGRFVFVSQFRKPVEREVLEIMAGTLEPGEDPDDCARRELQEETGYSADSIEKLGVILPAPGYTAEQLHIYFARLHGEQGQQNPDEDENIEVVYLTRKEIEKKILNGDISDAKSLAAWMLYERQESKQQ